MANIKTYETVPQVGRAPSPQSHTSQQVSLMDYGGGKHSLKQSTNTSRPSKTSLNVSTFNIRTLKSEDRLVELEEELQHIKWDILGLCETRLPGEKCTTLKSGHLMYQRNTENNAHVGGVAILVNKRLTHKVIEMRSISNRVIYITIKISQRYKLQVIQVYAPTSTAEDEEIESFYEDISMAQKDEKAHFTLIIGD
ncbi:hypothetical protein HHI36_001650 [Cryptolaemus montrouzieri]|uniref:Uncharacterized protein n=1 Tax=Cryptolaemus montrouzieri TaxID=559131 RepID=A0ABD2P8Y2_9CUCU